MVQARIRISFPRVVRSAVAAIAVAVADEDTVRATAHATVAHVVRAIVAGVGVRAACTVAAAAHGFSFSPVVTAHVSAARAASAAALSAHVVVVATHDAASVAADAHAAAVVAAATPGGVSLVAVAHASAARAAVFAFSKQYT